MISVKSSSPKVKSMNSSFIKTMNIFDIFYHFPQFEHNKSEVWKGKNLCAWGVKQVRYHEKNVKKSFFILLKMISRKRVDGRTVDNFYNWPYSFVDKLAVHFWKNLFLDNPESAERDGYSANKVWIKNTEKFIVNQEHTI